MFLRCRNSVSSTKGQSRQLFPFRDEHFDKVSTTIKFDTNFLWLVKTSFPRQSVIRNLKPPRARPSISTRRTCRRLFPPNKNVSFAFKSGISPPDEFHRKAGETTFRPNVTSCKANSKRSLCYKSTSKSLFAYRQAKLAPVGSVGNVVKRLQSTKATFPKVRHFSSTISQQVYHQFIPSLSRVSSGGN
jgi:hypothetical protein